MNAKSFDDVISLSDLRVNPGHVVKQVEDSCCPVLITCRGQGVAVLRSVRDYEAAEEERGFMRAIVAGLADVEAGRELSLADAKARLGLGELYDRGRHSGCYILFGGFGLDAGLVCWIGGAQSGQVVDRWSLLRTPKNLPMISI